MSYFHFVGWAPPTILIGNAHPAFLTIQDQGLNKLDPGTQQFIDWEKIMTTNNRDIDFFVAGHACLDIIPSFPTKEPMLPERVFRPGSLVNVTEAAISLGGPVSNTGLGLAKLGNKVELAARLGDDFFGRTTVKLMEEAASTEGIRIVDNETSSYTVAIAPPGIDRIFFHNTGTNDSFCVDDVDLDLCRRSKVFHFGYPPSMWTMWQNEGEQLIEIFRRAKSTGAITSLDMTLPDPESPQGRADWRPIIEKLMPYVDLYLPSIEETTLMLNREKHTRTVAIPGNFIDNCDGEDYTVLSDQLMEWGAKVVALKSGHRGFYCRTADKQQLGDIGLSDEQIANWASREIWSPAFQIEHIESATGSGDSACAGFLTGYLNGKDFEMCLRYAVSMGYQNLHHLDGLSGIKDIEYTVSVAEDYEKPLIPFELKSDGWVFNDEKKMWIGPNDRSG